MTSTQDRMLDSIIAAIRKHRLDDLIAVVRTIAAYDAAGIDTADGWGTTTPGNGSPGGGKGGGRQMATPGDDGEVDLVPTTSTEAAALMRLERGHPDEIHGLHRADVQALRKILDGMNTIAANAKRAENLRTITDVPEPPMCYVAGTMLGLPWDLMWERHVQTTFAMYLAQTWDEPRWVCRPIYEFVRQYRRTPTLEECKFRLEHGYFRVHQFGENVRRS